MICGGQLDVFLEPILPGETLYLFGAGHLSQSTAAVAKMLGLRVVVIDPRPEYNNNDRFPNADSLVVEEYDNAFSKLNVDENSYIVIYTPGHVSDEKCLQFAAGTAAKYVGMIGSKKKVKEVKERLRKKGVSQQQLDEIHAPIGLEINAQTPEEIAVSILAEITKVRRSGTQ
jgi:xanthine dehydrogenase accessory factor